jgi:hypothetical protein
MIKSRFISTVMRPMRAACLDRTFNDRGRRTADQEPVPSRGCRGRTTVLVSTVNVLDRMPPYS